MPLATKHSFPGARLGGVPDELRRAQEQAAPHAELPHAELDQLKVGLYIKVWVEAKQEVTRTEIVELDTGGEFPVKVRWPKKPGKKRPTDSWVKLTDCRVISEFFVDWEDIDEKLPMTQDPDSRQLRKDIFKDWDNTKANKLLSLKELQSGVHDLLGAEFGADVEETSTAVKCAWKVSKALCPCKKNKKLNDEAVNIKEFHAFIVALRYFLELAEFFERIDSTQEDDQLLSMRECKKGDFMLQSWGVTEADLQEKFAGKEPWQPCMKFLEFAEWCVEKRFERMTLSMELDSDDEEVVNEKGKDVARREAALEDEDIQEGPNDEGAKRKVVQLFKDWDADGNGSISEDELLDVFARLRTKLKEAQVKLLFAAADSNKNGMIDYEEFCNWIFR